MTLYANIIIDISLEKLDRTFQYIVPEAMQGSLKPGVQVRVPFGRGGRAANGYVLELTPEAEYDPAKQKEIQSIVPESIDAPNRMLELAGWIRTNYGGTMNQALKTVLPIRQKRQEKEERTIVLSVPKEKAQEVLAEYKRKHNTAKARMLEALIDAGELSYADARRKLSITLQTLRPMQEEGILKVVSDRVYRGTPIAGFGRVDEYSSGEHAGIPGTADRPDTAKRLNAVQRKIADDIIRNQKTGDHRPCLIHGVTGSGKTEVYLELIASAAAEGKPSIVMVPEIALTWQTVRRFTDRFGGHVGILHSRMSAGERFDQYERAQRGEITVMVGPRSALFTPFSEIGYIIIDEEHESSYKSENTPRYHVRETAIFRASQYDACVILGSATPSVESFRQAKAGAYHLYEMKERVGGRSMPQVYVEDMRRELKNGNRSILSDHLRELTAERLARGEQIMLFLNRRGMAGFVSCRSCGSVIKCPHCDVSLSLHRDDRMVCHYCGYEQPAARVCPSCGSKLIGGFRAGTQKIEAGIKSLFPDARILRMDADTTRKKGSYEAILSAMANREADILIGTQMIVKGHDFPYVTLVGILAADLSLNVPDYRASERTFQLLTQAAGRAGRGNSPGEVVIQTYQPDHYSIRAAREQDYEAFYEREMQFRSFLNYPPSWNMMVIHIAASEERDAQEMAKELSRMVRRYAEKDTQIIGPADAPIAKLRDIYRKVIYIKQAEYAQLVRVKDSLERQIKKNPLFKKGNIQFDFNPMGGF